MNTFFEFFGQKSQYRKATLPSPNAFFRPKTFVKKKGGTFDQVKIVLKKSRTVLKRPKIFCTINEKTQQFHQFKNKF